MLAPRLKKGDEIRIIAPARSIQIIGDVRTKQIVHKLQNMGFKVSFGKHVHEQDEFHSASVASRVTDLHEALRDKKVKLVMTVIGGFNSNQLLPHIDYKLIKKNPKLFIGYSDITALQNAFYAKTGLVSYSGPHFSSFGMELGFEYTEENLLMKKSGNLPKKTR